MIRKLLCIIGFHARGVPFFAQWYVAGHITPLWFETHRCPQCHTVYYTTK